MSDPILKVSGLWKSYKGGYPVIKDLNLELPEGRIIGLLGPNGCGKSTLMKLIAGLLVSDEGEITVAGEPRSELTCRLVSYLPERT
jgi:ABC-2 type transport system ATP-binding protein